MRIPDITSTSHLNPLPGNRDEAYPGTNVAGGLGLDEVDFGGLAGGLAACFE